MYQYGTLSGTGLANSPMGEGYLQIQALKHQLVEEG
jgi:hypothetical protein